MNWKWNCTRLRLREQRGLLLGRDVNILTKVMVVAKRRRTDVWEANPWLS